MFIQVDEYVLKPLKLNVVLIHDAPIGVVGEVSVYDFRAVGCHRLSFFTPGGQALASLYQQSGGKPSAYLLRSQLHLEKKAPQDG